MVNKKLNLIAFIVVMSSSLLGFIFFAIAMHELSHFEDYKNVSREGNLCFFNIATNGSKMLNSSAGYFIFKHHINDTEIVEEIEGYSETKAYGVSIVFTIIFFIFFILVIIERQKLYKLTHTQQYNGRIKRGKS